MKEPGYGHNADMLMINRMPILLVMPSIPDGVEEPGWYQAVPTGLEITITEKLAVLRKCDEEA